jgi:hypothetical protein
MNSNSNLFKQAHKNTREVKKDYPEVNYRLQFGFELKSLYEEKIIMDIKNMSLEQLKKLQKEINEQISVKENSKDEFNFKFDFEQLDTRKGVPYAALLYLDEKGKVNRDFFHLEKIYGKKSVNVTGQFKACVGEIIEQREGGSWKNDYRYWYLVTDKGTLLKVADISSSVEKTLVVKYLKNEISSKELIEKSI